MKILKNIMVLLTILLLLLNSCGSEDNFDTNEQSKLEAPPSLSENKKLNNNVLIKLDEKQKAELNINTEKISAQNYNYKITVPGFVFPAPENISVVSAPVDGRVISITAHEGESVRKGSVLCELESSEYGNLVAEYLQNLAEEKYQGNRYERIKQLVDKKISPQTDLDRTEADFLRATAARKASYSKLIAAGTDKAEIENWQSQSNIDPHLKIKAAISGTIDQHLIELGQSVTAYDKMLTLINLQKVLIRGYVAPEDGFFLKPGDKVKAFQKSNSDRIINAEITTINPALDEANKSIVVNIIAETDDRWPKPGENLRLIIDTKYPSPVITVPATAIAYEKENAVVYVKIDNTTYQQRLVNILKINGDRAIIESGLNEGEEIAVNQIFSLKALARFEQYAD